MRSKPLTRYSPPPMSTTATSSSSCSSAMSPTISSTMSSMVTMPAVPPYSSTTTATCRCSLCSSRSSSETFFVSATKDGGRARLPPLFFPGRPPTHHPRGLLPPRHEVRRPPQLADPLPRVPQHNVEEVLDVDDAGDPVDA